MMPLPKLAHKGKTNQPKELPPAASGDPDPPSNPVNDMTEKISAKDIGKSIVSAAQTPALAAVSTNDKIENHDSTTSNADSSHYYDIPVVEGKVSDGAEKSKGARGRTRSSLAEETSNERPVSANSEKQRSNEEAVPQGSSSDATNFCSRGTPAGFSPRLPIDDSMHAPGAHYVQGNYSAHPSEEGRLGDEEDGDSRLTTDTSLLPNMPAETPALDTPVAALVVDPEEDERRIQELEEQNRIL